MNADSILSLFRDHARATKVLRDDEVQVAYKLAEVLADFLSNRACQICDAAQGAPLFYSYQSDATSSLMVVDASVAGSSGKTIRKGRHLCEFLLERGFLVAPGSTRTSSAVIVKAPRFLNGKTTWHEFTAFVEFQDMPRARGHKGIQVVHAAFDRAVLSSMARKIEQRCAAYYDPDLGPDLDGNGEFLRLLDWFVSTACAHHDVHNSYKWAMHPFCSADVLTDLWIIMASLRNSRILLCASIPQWLTIVVRSGGPSDPDSDQAFWECLGVDISMIDLVCLTNPRWQDGALMVSEEVWKMQDCMSKVHEVLTYLFLWPYFNEARWCSLFTVCRCLHRGLHVGLYDLVAHVRADPRMSDEKLHGFGKLSAKIRKFICVGVMAASVPEAVSEQLLHDCRLVQTISALEVEVQMVNEYISNLPLAVWTRMATVVVAEEYSGTALRADALSCSHEASVFLQKRIFDEVRRYPFSLAIGDIDGNLDRLLASTDEADSGCTEKVRSLLRCGYNRQALIRGIQMLRYVEFSTRAVEQGHGTTATLHRYHPDYSVMTMIVRAMIHQCRAMFMPSRDDSQLARLEARRNRVQSRSVL